MNIKNYIETTLLDILKKKPIEKIKVNEIIRKVGTCKGTFYKYYMDKYELLHCCFQNHIYAGILKESVNWSSFIMSSLDAFEKEPLMILNSFRSEDVNSVRYYHEKLIIGFFEKDMGKNCDAQISKINSFSVRICAASYTDIILKWLEGGMKESKEELLMYMCAAMPKSIDSKIFAIA